MTSPNQEHIPVMLREVVEALCPRDGGIYIDATFGRGGYSRALLNAGNTEVIGIDKDPDAIAKGHELVQAYSPRLKLIHGSFGQMDNLLGSDRSSKIDGITFDLGVSSPQLDQAERGFSFQEDGPLDMRMSRTGKTAADIINTSSENELADIIFKFGEERFSRRVARRIVEARADKPILRTRELAELVRDVVPRSKDGVDPATRTFQGLRIAVNDELGEIEQGLKAAEKLLKPNGRLAIVSFHSLEDRCVKNFLRDASGSAPHTSRHAPTLTHPSVKTTFRLLTRKPQVPSGAEIEANPRSRSAKLRVAERTSALIPTETSV
jgi:16S rRNA (cytosine1402-N4)-methyltransferase